MTSMRVLTLDTPCLEWVGARDAYGYGMRRYEGKVVRVHRIAFYEATGWWPEAVLHLCDNPPCHNPSHLRGGTRADNNADRDAKGRGATRQAVCGYGHEMPESGRCKPCAARRQRAYYLRGASSES